MDKPNKGQITIKLNGEVKEIKEISKKIYPETGIDPYSIENEIDSPNIEQETLLETAAAQEAVDESFDWIIPDMTENEIEEYKIASSHSAFKKSTPVKKKPGRSYSSIIFPGIFAILIGTTFGFLMLKLVLTEHSNKAITEPAAVEQQGTKEAAGNTVSAVIKSFTPYVVQEGMYTTKASASDAAKKAEGLGLPAKAIEIGDKVYLFLGVADSQETAKKIGGLYKDKGIEGFYAKTLAMDEKTLSNVNELEKTFLETVPSVYQSLSKMTSDAIVTKKIAEDKTKEIDVLLSESGIKNETVKQIRAELFAAEESLKSYQKTKQSKDLTESQQHLLNFLSQYNKLK